MRFRISFITFFAAGVYSFAQTPNQKQVKQFADNVFALSEVMLHDVASPPAASRFYAYSILGAYEALYLAERKLPNINARIRHNPITEVPKRPQQANAAFCANYTLLQVGRNIMPSGPMLVARQQELIRFFRKKHRLSKKSIDEHVRFCELIAAQVLASAKQDGYNKLSTLKRYTPSKEEGHWFPTPPEYMAAVEPQWKIVRPFFLDSATQFPPPVPAAFSKEPGSDFYTQMMEVYNIGNALTQEQRNIANYWDCNPFAVTYSGHMAIGLKKISPGGHWMGITGIACGKANLSLDSAVIVHTAVALASHDSFISCWKEKYDSDRIRPETAINKMVDPAWRPVLQTPPFPEHTSGHSVVSATAAVILTYLLGDHFGFIDTSEMYFGLPERKFDSFIQASDEAAISRLYGGIHFRDSCVNGVSQGKKIGNLAIDKLFRSDVSSK